jgi:ketosteroid isomerase-like protein
MSAEELAREVWRRWNAGEREPDLELFNEDVEIHSVLTQSTFTGYEGVRAWAAEIDEQFARFDLEVDEFEAFGPDLVAMRGSIRLQGRESGLEMEQPASWLITARDGRISFVRNYMGRDEAHEVAARERRGET